MIIWSERDSNSGSITFSRHWIERLDDVALPEVSSCVQAGSRYTPSFLTIALIAAVADGYGSITTIRSRRFIASTISRPRDWLLGEWPQ